MPVYLSRTTGTPEVVAALVKNPQNREEYLRQSLEAMGGKLLGLYFVVGSNETVSLTEWPDEVTVHANAMAIFGSGALTSVKTEVLIPYDKAVEAMRKAQQSTYRPPS